MYKVRYLEENDKLRPQVSLSHLESLYAPQFLEVHLQQHYDQQHKAHRVRHFLPLSVFWFVLAMALWNRLAQGRVWDRLSRHWQALGAEAPLLPAGASALTYQRERLGSEPLQQVFAQCCPPMCTPQTPGAFFRGYRLMALDGTRFNLPDTPANDATFGRSQNQYGKGAYPQAQVQLLMECGSHGVTALTIGRMERGEIHGAMELLPSIQRGMLLLHDSCFVAGAFWETLSQKGVLVLSALASTVMLKRERNLPDGSYLAQLKPQRASAYQMHRAIWVRVIEYQLTDQRLGVPGQVYRLVTTWLNPRTAPAKTLIVLYHERWEIEGAIDEVKTHQREQKKVLRSRTPEGIKQEIWALFLVHYAIRALMYRSALQADLDPDRLSFTEALFQLTETGADAPLESADRRAQREQHLLLRLRRNLLPPRRLRVNPRQVKQINKRFPAKKREMEPPKAFEPEEHFADFVLLLSRPSGSRDLVDAIPICP